MKKILAILLLTVTVVIYSQTGDGSSGMGIGLANQTINGLNYQTIALMPELNLGFFGIGLNVDLRFTLKVVNEEPTFEIYKEDWVIEDGDWQDYLSLYLAKIAYIRMGHKNESFYLKAGQFSGATLGNGTILNDYSNMQYMPEIRIFGLALDIDGSLFNFPYLGFESFIGNVAAMDVVGGRIYARPFRALEVPVISNIEIATTGVIDRDPYFFNSDIDSTEDNLVKVFGADITIPLLDSALFTMNIYSDLVFENISNAKIYGLGGKLLSLIHYNIQYIDQSKNYISEYFGAGYDLNRTGSNYNVYKGLLSISDVPAKKDMSATLGMEIPQILYFDAKLSGILTMADDHDLSPEEAPYLYPSLKGTVHLDNQLLKIVSADFFYLKNGIDTFSTIFNPLNAIIGGNVNYYSGNMVVSFIVDVKYNADAVDKADEWITNTQISVNFKL